MYEYSCFAVQLYCEYARAIQILYFFFFFLTKKAFCKPAIKKSLEKNSASLMNNFYLSPEHSLMVVRKFTSKVRKD